MGTWYPLALPPEGPPETSKGWFWPGLLFDQERGALEVAHGQPPWPPFVPLADGAPLLKGHKLLHADWKRGTLATLFQGPGNACVLRLFPCSAGVPALSLAASPSSMPTLSNGGRLLAYQRRVGQVEVRPTGGGSPLRQTLVGRFHNNVGVELGERWLGLSFDRTHHLIRWDRGRLAHKCLRGPDGKLLLRVEMSSEPFASSASPPADVPSVSARTNQMPDFLRYDTHRFRGAAWLNLRAVVDAFGQVFLFERSGYLVCAFFAYRLALAAWMPDGTCLGPTTLLGRSETPGAAEKIGQALQAAWERGRGTTS
jgi:hypothetical protein